MIPKDPIATEVLCKPQPSYVWAIGGLHQLEEEQEDGAWWREVRQSGVCVGVSRNNEGLDAALMPISGLLKSEVQDLPSVLTRVLHYKSLWLGPTDSLGLTVLPLPGACYVTSSEASDLPGSVSLSVKWG